MKILELKKVIESILEDNKANNIVSINLKNKSYIADYMIIASGTSSKHIQSLSKILILELKKIGLSNCKLEGEDSEDWKLVDALDIIVHIFHPEKENFMTWKKCGLSQYLLKRSLYEKNIFFSNDFFNIFLFRFSTNAKNSNDLYEKIDLFSEVLEKVKSQYVDEVDQAEAMDSAINGVLQSLDPYSAYMSPELFDNMKTDTKGEFGGLGIEIGMESGVVKVISPIDDTPAAKAGIKAGDYIVRINDKQVQGKSLMEAVKLMRGKVNTNIKLTIRRKGQKKALDFNIKRAVIEVKSVDTKLLGNKEKIGYLRLKSFNENSADQLFKRIENFEKKNKPKGYIIDLRNNPGGLLTQAII